MKRIWKFGIILMVSALSLISCTSSSTKKEEKVEIVLASPFKEGHILCQASDYFADLIAERSASRITVEVRKGAGSEEEINIACEMGDVQMQATGGEPLEVYAPDYFFVNTPYVMKDFEHFMRVWDGDIGKAAKKIVSEQGNMNYLGIVYRGLRQMTTKKPIYTSEDIEGLKLRLPGVPSWIAVWEGIGASPVPVPLTELYASLADGRAEASEGDLPQIVSFKLDEVQTHLIITNHLVQTGGILINKAFFDGLSISDQELVVSAAKEASDWANNYIKENEGKLLEDLQQKGMEVVIPDAQGIREKAKPAVEDLFRTQWPATSWEEILAQ